MPKGKGKKGSASKDNEPQQGESSKLAQNPGESSDSAPKAEASIIKVSDEGWKVTAEKIKQKAATLLEGLEKYGNRKDATEFRNVMEKIDFKKAHADRIYYIDNVRFMNDIFIRGMKLSVMKWSEANRDDVAVFPGPGNFALRRQPKFDDTAWREFKINVESGEFGHLNMGK